MNTILILVIGAILIETIYNGIKPIYDPEKRTINWGVLGPFVVALIVCLLADLDIFPLVGIPLKLPYVGNVLTSLIVGRGSNVVHDLIKTITSLRAETTKSP